MRTEEPAILTHGLACGESICHIVSLSTIDGPTRFKLGEHSSCSTWQSCRLWHGSKVTDVGRTSLKSISIRPHRRRWQACARTFTATMHKPRAYRNACRLWAHDIHARRHAANLPTDPHAKWSPAEPQHQNLRPIPNARAHGGGTRCGPDIRFSPDCSPGHDDRGLVRSCAQTI